MSGLFYQEGGSMNLTVEILEVKAKKAGLDKEFRVVFITDDERVLKLQNYIAKDTVEIEVHDEDR
jgi:rRNA maturation endonuclease Nob1